MTTCTIPGRIASRKSKRKQQQGVGQISSRDRGKLEVIVFGGTGVEVEEY
jgi:hypothetical protein